MNIQFGNYKIPIRKENEQKEIFCVVRKKWLICTPEEQVRQIWLHYLINDLGKDAASIAVEKKVAMGNRTIRYDICVFANSKPYILIECKAPNVSIGQITMEQLSRYNLFLESRIVIITNGLTHIGYRIFENKVEKIEQLES